MAVASWRTGTRIAAPISGISAGIPVECAGDAIGPSPIPDDTEPEIWAVIDAALTELSGAS